MRKYQEGATPDVRSMREIKYEHSEYFVPILEHLKCSLVISTYAAGKVLTIGVCDGELQIRAVNFEQAMGLAVGTTQLAVGARNLVWFLSDVGNLARMIEPEGRFDMGYRAHKSLVTGDIQIHEMAFDRSGELWVVNTLFSCRCTLDEQHNFVPRWRPPFVTKLAAEDRCHLNGLAMLGGKPRYVSALGVSDVSGGWRKCKASGGVIIDIESEETVVAGLCMPHSPRIHEGALYVLDSGRGQLATVDLDSGAKQVVTDFPGYGRGLASCGQFMFIGLSRARETSVFGDVPICEQRDRMRCGIAVVDLQMSRCVAFLQFTSGVEELFDVQVCRSAVVRS